jgi:hypothetical protein
MSSQRLLGGLPDSVDSEGNVASIRKVPPLGSGIAVTSAPTLWKSSIMLARRSFGMPVNISFLTPGSIGLPCFTGY